MVRAKEALAYVFPTSDGYSLRDHKNVFQLYINSLFYFFYLFIYFFIIFFLQSKCLLFFHLRNTQHTPHI